MYILYIYMYIQVVPVYTCIYCIYHLYIQVVPVPSIHTGCVLFPLKIKATAFFLGALCTPASV